MQLTEIDHWGIWNSQVVCCVLWYLFCKHKAGLLLYFTFLFFTGQVLLYISQLSAPLICCLFFRLLWWIIFSVCNIWTLSATFSWLDGSAYITKNYWEKHNFIFHFRLKMMNDGLRPALLHLYSISSKKNMGLISMWLKNDVEKHHLENNPINQFYFLIFSFIHTF